VRTEMFGTSEPGIGTRYRLAYEMSGHSSEFDAEIVEFSPPRRFAARLVERNQGDGSHADRFMIESYDLLDRRGGTRILHDVAIHFAGVPWWVAALAWVITRLGKPTGQTYVEKLARLAERPRDSDPLEDDATPWRRAGGAQG